MPNVLSHFAFSFTLVLLLNSSSFSQQSTIDKLERRVAALERRVASLEEKMSSTPSQTIQYSEKWKDRSLWRKLRNDMSMEQVESLLGIPKKISGSGNFTHWYYSTETWKSYVSFYKGLVDGWKEPD